MLRALVRLAIVLTVIWFFIVIAFLVLVGTGGLDPVQRAEVQTLLAGMRGSRTVLLCTHDLSEARALTSRVAILNRGRLVTQGATKQVLADDSALSLFQDADEVLV